MIYIGAVFVLVAIAGALFGKITTEHYGRPGTEPTVKVEDYRMWAAVPAVIGVLLLALSTVTIINAGEVGVEVTFGKIQEQTLEEGVNVHNPFSRIVRITVQDQLYTVGSDNGNGVTVRLRDDNTAPVEFTVRYALDPNKANSIYRTQGAGYADKLIIPIARSVIRDVMGDFRAEEIAESRREIGLQVQAELVAALEPEGLFVRAFELRNVDLPASFDQAVERKLEAEQLSQEKAFALETAKQDAEIARTKAQGEADANSILAASLEGGEYILALRYIEALDKIWGAGNSTIFMPSDFQQDFLFNLGVPQGGAQP